MKYFLELMYDGTAYAGWQRQKNALTVQQVLEDRISRILQIETPITGCGRTDAGVHARSYIAHLESGTVLDDQFLHRMNSFLPSDIAISRIILVTDDAHARFDATERSYVYFLHFKKNPFLDSYSFYYRRAANYPLDMLNHFSQALLNFTDFQSFAKVHSDVHHHRCDLRKCLWKETEYGYELHITSDRFLRGMVRLITGACLRYAEGKITIADLESAMKSGAQIKRSWSVPAHGLSLTDIKYPYI